MTYNKKVIEFKSATKWKFYDFCPTRRTNPIENWYQEELSLEAQQFLDDILKDCSKIENPKNWAADLRHLQGKPKEYKIWEIRFKCDDRQYRLLGVFGPERQEATFLIGCHHKQKIYIPSSALDTACKRAADLRDDKGERIEREIKTDR